jgi:hypothetical protein
MKTIYINDELKNVIKTRPNVLGTVDVYVSADVDSHTLVACYNIPSMWFNNPRGTTIKTGGCTYREGE